MTPLTISAAIVLAVILWFIGSAYLKRGQDLISWRNLFLFGVAYFYCGTILYAGTLIGTLSGEAHTVQGTGYLPLAFALPLFLALFLGAGNLASKWKWPEKLAPKLDYPVTTAGVIAIAFTFLGALILSLPLRGLGVVEGVIVYLRPALGVTGVGLLFYLVITNPRNPVWWALLIPAVGIVAISTTIGGIGRRDFISVFLVMGWIWWYARLRFETPRAALTKLAAVAAVGIFCLLAFNTIRAKGVGADFNERQRQFAESVTDVNRILSYENIVGQLLLQDTPLNTVAIMESYPDPFPHIPLHGLTFYATNPIPRAVYQNKPVALGILLQRQFRTAANLGPGIIGHGWAEAHWIGVAYYALFFGALTAIADRLVRNRGHNPYFCVLAGCALGQVLGLPRGETSLFMVGITVGTAGVIIIFWVAGIVLRPYMLLGSQLPLLLPPSDADNDSHDNGWNPDDQPPHDDYDWYTHPNDPGAGVVPDLPHAYANGSANGSLNGSSQLAGLLAAKDNQNGNGLGSHHSAPTLPALPPSENLRRGSNPGREPGIP